MALSQADRDRLGEYRDTHTRCAVCYGKGKGWNPLEIHHIVGRYGKQCHDHRNLIVLDRDCHAGFHFGGGCSLRLGHILLAKEELGELDIPFLASLRRRAGLREDPTPLPAWALDARKDNR
jgi:hypothetical protein